MRTSNCQETVRKYHDAVGKCCIAGGEFDDVSGGHNNIIGENLIAEGGYLIAKEEYFDVKGGYSIAEGGCYNVVLQHYAPLPHCHIPLLYQCIPQLLHCILLLHYYIPLSYRRIPPLQRHVSLLHYRFGPHHQGTGKHYYHFPCRYHMIPGEQALRREGKRK